MAATTKTHSGFTHFPSLRFLVYASCTVVFVLVLLAEFVAPYALQTSRFQQSLAPPQRLHLLEQTESGLRIRPHVFGYVSERDPTTLRTVYTEDRTHKIYLDLFVEGDPYQLWGIFDANSHLIGSVPEDGPFYLLGADQSGRDRLTLLIYATRFAVVFGLLNAVVILLLASVPVMLLGRYGNKINRVAGQLLNWLRNIPTIILRLLLLVLWFRYWPLLFAMGNAIVRQWVMMPAAGYAVILIAGFLLGGLAFLINRRLLVWLLLPWLWFWLIRPANFLTYLMLSNPDTEFFSLLFMLLPHPLKPLLLLTLFLWPILIVALYGESLILNENNGLHGSFQARYKPKHIGGLILYVMALTIPLEIWLGLRGFSSAPPFISFGMLQAALNNIQTWSYTPWRLIDLLPPLFLFGLLLVVTDLWLRNLE